MQYAWIENGVIRDLTENNPVEVFHPDIAKLFDTQVPAEAQRGDAWANGTLTKPEAVNSTPAPEPTPVVPPKVDVITYKLLFTSAERIATKASTDPVIVDLQDLMNDPRTVNVDLALKSVQDALDYMTHIGILAGGRKAEILTGVVR